MQATRHWAFLLAAAIPCVALLVFCGIGIHEWWLISTHQIAVIPTPRPGEGSAPEVPAARLLPMILGSGFLAALFAYAFRHGSGRILASAYLAVFLVLGAAYLRHHSALTSGLI